MKKTILICAMAMVTACAFAGLFGIQYNSATTNAVPTIATSGLPFAPQPASANLTNWSSIAVTSVQPSSANLTNWSSTSVAAVQPSSANLTNLSSAHGEILTFTNAAGARFALVVNSSTNGFTFVAQ